MESFDEFITDEKSGNAWRNHITEKANEEIKRAEIVPLDRFLLDSELENFRSQLEILVENPDDFLRTRILRYIETNHDPRIQLGLIGYIQSDINLLNNPYI